MKRYVLYVALFSLIFIQATVVSAAGDVEVDLEPSSILELENEVRDLKKELVEMKREIKGLKSFVESRLPDKLLSPPSRSAKLVTGKTGIKDDPFLGSKESQLILVEFSDFQCPFCEKFFRTTLPQIKREYIDSGELSYVFKDFPLAFHKEAKKAAEASHCGGEQGKYWEMHDLIFENQRQMNIADLVAHAEKLVLNVDDFKECIESDKYANGINEDIKAGQSSGVTGTPSFLLGKVNGKGEVEGRIIRGAQPYEVFKQTIETMLRKDEKAKD
jgi:protein-disulfide isomerase